MEESVKSFDIAVVGAGAAGLAAALALAREGFATALVGAPDPRRDGRTVALLDGSVRFLKALGVWPSLAPDAAPLAIMQILDDTGSLFRPPPVSFSAAEIELPAFGWNVENHVLVTRLAAAAGAEPRLTLVPERATEFTISDGAGALGLEGGDAIQAALLVAADGRNSRLRDTARITTKSWAYPQSALTTILAHDRDHEDTSTEFHTRSGPFTLVPLPGRRSSLVWVMSADDAARRAALDDAALALAIERQAQSLLGKMTIDGPRGVVPLSGLSVERYSAPRLALVGETAHVLPPIGAQGLNLGLRDAAALRDAVLDARAAGRDIGGNAALAVYQRGRDLDVRLRSTAVDGLNRTLLVNFLPADLLRGLGLLALGGIGPLRRAAMREGVAPSIGAPRLMQANPVSRAAPAHAMRRNRFPGRGARSRSD
jgi:2-octaprenyl-6-methoxyphenol hydroxylase